MTNLDQAEKAIKFGAARGYTPEQIATLLRELELLAEDLPEANDPSIFVPDGKAWLPCGPDGPSVWTAPDSLIMVQRIEPGDLTPEEAEALGLALLAAAQHTKRQA